MNTFLHENLITILVFVLLLLLILMGFMVFIFYKLLINKNTEVVATSKSENTDFENIKLKLKKDIKVEEKFYCTNHNDIPSVGSCLICEEVFCEKCLVEHEGLSFCKQHFKTYANHRWVQITDTKTTPDSPEDGLYIYQTKKEIWENDGIPSFVVTHYKINIESDFIESFIQLNVREEDSHQLKIRLENNKARL